MYCFWSPMHWSMGAHHTEAWLSAGPVFMWRAFHGTIYESLLAPNWPMKRTPWQHFLWHYSNLQIVKNHNQILENGWKHRREWSNQFQFHTGRINILKIKVSMYCWPPSTYCCAHLLTHAHDPVTLCQDRLAEQLWTYSPRSHVKARSLSCVRAFS